jgi:HEAT repeat protein
VKRLATVGCVAVLVAGTLHASQSRQIQQNYRQRNRAQITVEQVWLAADRIRADRWYPDGTLFEGARDLNRNADMDLLLLASASEFPLLRKAAVREFGRFETVDNAEFIAAFLEDEDPDVRIEAVDALVQTLIERPEMAATVAVQPLEFRLLRETEPDVVVAIWQALVQVPLGHDVSEKFERLFLNQIQQQGQLRVEAGKALVELLWRRNGRPALAETVQSLKQWFLAGASNKSERVQVGTTVIGDTVTFLEGLQAAQVDDDLVLERADQSPNQELRRRAVEMYNPFDPRHRERLERMAKGRDLWTRDPAILRLLANPEVPLCELLSLATRPEVARRVVAALGASKQGDQSECADWSPVRALLATAEKLPTAVAPRTWQVPLAALEELAPRMPTEAGAIARLHAAFHSHWMVRAAAARVAAITKDTDLALRLAEDTHPNVHAEALTTLATLKHPLLPALAITALGKADYHLIRTAANVLEGGPGPAQLLPPLVTTFERVSQGQKDTSRELRLALLSRIQEMGLRSPADGSRWAITLMRYLEDFDPVVAQQVSVVVLALTGDLHPIRPKHREALQPSVAMMRQVPACVRVEFDDSDPWEIALDREQAPLATARFWMEARSRYYNGQHVMYADENVTGFGSPRANEYTTIDRFIRDEMGGAVRAGAVVLRGFGRDTLDGRLHVHWKDARARDRRDTVIGHVTLAGRVESPGVRPVLPGSRIVRVVECPDR